jgi:hypothetical protein
MSLIVTYIIISINALIIYVDYQILTRLYLYMSEQTSDD